MNLEDNARYIVGDVRRGLSEKYGRCRHSPGSAACANCWQDYLSGALAFPGAQAALKMHNAASKRLADKISAQAKKSPSFKRYLLEAKKRIYE
jgi:hypothetical protein